MTITYATIVFRIDTQSVKTIHRNLYGIDKATDDITNEFVDLIQEALYDRMQMDGDFDLVESHEEET